MLAVGAFITIFCKIKLGDIASTSVFKSGMVACICVLGVAWLGDTFVSGHTAQIKAFASETISQYPALLAVVFFLAAMLLYSQARYCQGDYSDSGCRPRHHSRSPG